MFAFTSTQNDEALPPADERERETEVHSHKTLMMSFPSLTSCTVFSSPPDIAAFFVSKMESDVWYRSSTIARIRFAVRKGSISTTPRRNAGEVIEDRNGRSMVGTTNFVVSGLRDVYVDRHSSYSVQETGRRTACDVHEVSEQLSVRLWGLIERVKRVPHATLADKLEGSAAHPLQNIELPRTAVDQVRHGISHLSSYYASQSI